MTYLIPLMSMTTAALSGRPGPPWWNGIPGTALPLATKLCAWRDAPDEEAAKRQLYTSLERTGAGYFDYYLLHSIQTGNLQRYDDLHLWDFVQEQKAKGLIRHWGFSFHAGPELLDKLLTEHPEADFVQLQLNYADWENPDVTSRANYEVARRHGKPIVVMEPVKGGALAQPIPAVQQISARPTPTPPSPPGPSAMPPLWRAS